MHPPELTERGGQDLGPARRPSRWARLRPGRSLVAFPAVVAGGWALLIAVPAVVGQLFGPEDDRGTWGEVLGAVVGNFIVVFVLALLVSGILRRSTAGSVRTPPEQVDWSPPQPPAPPAPARTSPAEPRATPGHNGTVRRVVRGGVIGALPGLLIVGIPALLHTAGAISADQSQIGFIGVPLLLIGTFAGILITAADTGDSGRVMVGATIGFVGGLAIGTMTTAGIGLPGLWLVIAAAGSIAGAAFSVRRGHQRTPRSRPG